MRCVVFFCISCCCCVVFAFSHSAKANARSWEYLLCFCILFSRRCSRRSYCWCLSEFNAYTWCVCVYVFLFSSLGMRLGFDVFQFDAVIKLKLCAPKLFVLLFTITTFSSFYFLSLLRSAHPSSLFHASFMRTSTIFLFPVSYIHSISFAHSFIIFLFAYAHIISF